MSESNIIGPVKCFTVENGEVQRGIAIYGSHGNRAVSLNHVNIPVDETDFSAIYRLNWAYVVNNGGELKILPCVPPEMKPDHSFETLVKVIAVDDTRPLLQYNNERVWTRILRRVQTCTFGMTFHYEGVQLLALLGWHDKITVYESKPGAPREGRSFSEAWSVSGTELFENF